MEEAIWVRSVWREATRAAANSACKTPSVEDTEHQRRQWTCSEPDVKDNCRKD